MWEGIISLYLLVTAKCKHQTKHEALNNTDYWIESVIAAGCNAAQVGIAGAIARDNTTEEMMTNVIVIFAAELTK